MNMGKILCGATLVLALVNGCTGKSAATPPAGQPPTPVKSEGPLTSNSTKWKDWRWKGTGDDCFYLAKNQCFKDKSAACDAADCSGRCTADRSSAPAVIRCKK